MSKTSPTDHDTGIAGLDGLTAHRSPTDTDSVYFTASDGGVSIPQTQQRSTTAPIAHAPSTQDPRSSDSHRDDTNSLKVNVHAASVDPTTSNAVDATTVDVGAPIADTQQRTTKASSAHAPSTQSPHSSDTYCNDTDDLTAPFTNGQNGFPQGTESMRSRAPWQPNRGDKYDSTDDEEGGVPIPPGRGRQW
ncbi:MAG: hypothetical protein L6R42_002385 [Xanthoria sp. 1 TBL-2021]|nr:MAG: hypothetical protein L6R42_002385 [Xanthoria sp. 1 TBL-2021]